MGMVLVSRASHVLTFGHASFRFSTRCGRRILCQYRGWPYPVAVVAGLLGGAVTGGPTRHDVRSTSAYGWSSTRTRPARRRFPRRVPPLRPTVTGCNVFGNVL